MMDELIARLSERMTSPLPGLQAQLPYGKSVSNYRRQQLQPRYLQSQDRCSAHCSLSDNGVIRTVLMKRSDYDGTHSGQISFPGGKVEDVDVDIVATALREAEEEVNIKPSEVRVIGQLTELYISPSNFLVHPILGILRQAS
jgi:hypothetical protein